MSNTNIQGDYSLRRDSGQEMQSHSIIKVCSRSSRSSARPKLAARRHCRRVDEQG